MKDMYEHQIIAFSFKILAGKCMTFSCSNYKYFEEKHHSFLIGTNITNAKGGHFLYSTTFTQAQKCIAALEYNDLNTWVSFNVHNVLS